MTRLACAAGLNWIVGVSCGGSSQVSAVLVCLVTLAVLGNVAGRGVSLLCGADRGVLWLCLRVTGSYNAMAELAHWLCDVCGAIATFLDGNAGPRLLRLWVWRWIGCACRKLFVTACAWSSRCDPGPPERT